MEIVKKNILSIICGVVALTALVALAWPVGGMYDSTQSQLNARKSVDTDLGSLLNKHRAWPVIPEVETGAQSPLNRFPNDEVIKAGTAIKEQVHEQAANMKRRTATDNQHFLLVTDVLPNPRDLDLRFEFQKIYLEQVQDIPATAQAPARDGILKKQLMGTSPPTDQDILTAADKLWVDQYKGKILNVGGKDVNRQQIEDEWQQACAPLPNKLRVQAAQQAKLYTEPDWLSIQNKMPNNPHGPEQTDVWFAQNMLWVQRDVVDAIARINASAHDVIDAPIKHIFRIDVPDDITQYVVNGPNSARNNNAPSTDTPGKAYAVSPTGRVCNPLYDVVQFTLVMNVDKQLIPSILANLQAGKLITVQQLDMSAVDGIAAANEGFIYGDVEVAKLTIHGEELFLRDWTVPLMPDQIKALLQVPTTPANQK